nr:conjugative transfer protein MobI(A/C) [Paracoccus sp. C2R09]
MDVGRGARVTKSDGEATAQRGYSKLPYLIRDEIEDLHLSLIERAKDLVAECHAFLDAEYKERRFQTLPMTMSARQRKDRFGPVIVWVRISLTKRKLQNGSFNRFTTEIPGRRYHMYPRSTFRSFRDADIIERLVNFESRAAVIRRQTSHWNSIIRSSKSIIDDWENGR